MGMARASFAPDALADECLALGIAARTRGRAVSPKGFSLVAVKSVIEVSLSTTNISDIHEIWKN